MSEVACLGECQVNPHNDLKTRDSKAKVSSRVLPRKHVLPKKRGASRRRSSHKQQDIKSCTVPKCPYELSFNGQGWPSRDLRVFPQGYRISAPVFTEATTLKTGDELIIYLSLFGKASEYASYWLQALVKAAARGLSHERFPFYLAQANDALNEQELYQRYLALPPLMPTQAPLKYLIDLPANTLDWSSLSIRIRFVRPYIQKNNQTDPDLASIIRAVLRRVHALYYRFHEPIDHPLSGDEINHYSKSTAKGEFVLYQQSRFSSTAQRHIPQNGIIGERTYAQCQAPQWVYETLALGVFTGIGQQVNMGLGSYELELVDCSSSLTNPISPPKIIMSQKPFISTT